MVDVHKFIACGDCWAEYDSEEDALACCSRVDIEYYCGKCGTDYTIEDDAEECCA